MSDLPDGGTPIDADEAADLIPTHIHTHDELNAWEQANIVIAAESLLRTTKPALSEAMIRNVHRRMFDRTWRWAGRYRTSDKNIGVYWATVSEEVRNLTADGSHWIANGTYPIDEAVVRLHHRLVKVHPFPNGNGRHARLWGDLVLKQNGRPPLAWKSELLDQQGDPRSRYIGALRRADAGHFDELFELVLRGR